MLGIPFYVEYMMNYEFRLLIGIHVPEKINDCDRERFKNAFDVIPLEGHYALRDIAPDNRKYCSIKNDDGYLPISQYIGSEPNINELFAMLVADVHYVSENDRTMDSIRHLFDFSTASYVLEYNDILDSMFADISGCGVIRLVGGDNKEINTFIKKQKLINSRRNIQPYDLGDDDCYILSDNIVLMRIQGTGNVH